MDIGTAKPTLAERQGIPHHLIDIVNPDEAFSVADFQALATTAIDAVTIRQRLPIVTGGTGLYVRALTVGYAFSASSTDRALRERLEAEAETDGNEARAPPPAGNGPRDRRHGAPQRSGPGHPGARGL